MSKARQFSFVIVGGSILGSAVAALAAGSGYEPLVIRRPDTVAPNADTLRNQGWLQSGVMYKLKDFASLDAYVAFAGRTFTAGRELLARCNLPLPRGGGLIRACEEHHLEDLAQKQELLRFSHGDFFQLETADAKVRLGEFYEEGSTYYQIPDGPFDEAGVLRHLRDEATRLGAAFVEVEAPVRLERSSNDTKVFFENGDSITSPTVVVCAGAGSFELMAQCRAPLNGQLQRTPLMVADAPTNMPAEIMVDLGRGFSAVQHVRGQQAPPAIVMGTRAKLRHEAPPERVITSKLQQEFATAIPPLFQPCMATGRFTAGYEVLPHPGVGVSEVEPWVHAEGAVIFASPGRATVSALAATDVLASVLKRKQATKHGLTSAFDPSSHTLWNSAINMHFDNPPYTFNDAEVFHV